MGVFLKKSTAVALTALFIGLGAAAATTTPADAAGVWHRGGYYGGGWRGGYWGPAVGLGILGLAAGAALASPYYGYGYSPYYGYGYGPGYGYGYGPGPYNGYGYGYGPGPYYGAANYGAGPNGCAAYRPVYDRGGRFLGRRWVDICQ